MPRYHEHDYEAYDRPRRHTRPRTKERPTYDDAVEGRVVTVDRGRYTPLVDARTVTAMKSRPLGRKGVVVGDEVRLVGDVTGSEGSRGPSVEGHEQRSGRSRNGARCCEGRRTTTTRWNGSSSRMPTSWWW